MSVPVLSWLLSASRQRTGRLPSRRSRSRRPAAWAVRAQSCGGCPFRLPPRSAPSSPSPTSPTLRANPFPKVTDPFCRLPLPTLFYQLEAVHLGDLLRFAVRQLRGRNDSWIFTGHSGCIGHGMLPCSCSECTSSLGNPLPRSIQKLNRNDISAQYPGWRLQVSLRRHSPAAVSEYYPNSLSGHQTHFVMFKPYPPP